jgi:hypothetical protein
MADCNQFITRDKQKLYNLNVKKNIFFLLIILIFSVLGLSALLHPGLYSAHDIWHHVARLYHYQKAVFEGTFPPYWIGTLAGGLGYPLFIYSYTFPFLLGVAFLALGINLFNVLKLLFFLSYFASGVFMYCLVNSMYKNRMAGALAAILYLWVPYHFVTILVAASISIAFAFTFIPLLLWGIYLLSQEKTKPGMIFTALGLAGIILSQLQAIIPLLPLLFFFFVAMLLNSKNRKGFIIGILLSLFLGLGLSAFYLLPAFYYKGFALGYGEIYQKGFIDLKQLIYSKWGYGIINNSAKEGAFSFQLGIAQWLIVIGSTVSLFIKRVSKKEKLTTILLLTGFAVSVFMLLDISGPVWALLARYTPVNYPYRYMLTAVFISSFLAGYLYTKLGKKTGIIFAIGIILVTLFTNRNHLKVNMYTDYSLKEYVEAEGTTSTYHEFWPKWADLSLLAKPVGSPVDNPEIKIKDFVQKENDLAFTATTPKNQGVTINHLAFPGITLYLDSQKTNYIRTKDGRILADITKGEHKILVRFENTPAIRLGEVISLISLLTLILIVVIKKQLFYH